MNKFQQAQFLCYPLVFLYARHMDVYTTHYAILINKVI
jgi:hypothetical protein